MKNYVAIEFIALNRKIVPQATNDIRTLFDSIHCILPSLYCGTETDSLILVWRYTKHKNHQAWDVCHHIPHMLFQEQHSAFVNFCDKYQTVPVVFSSEECCRMLRFGNPQAFTYSGDIPWASSGCAVLSECDFDSEAFTASVESLLAKNIEMIRSFQEREIGKLDFSMLYLLCKKVEAMAITTDRYEQVQPYLNVLYELLRR